MLVSTEAALLETLARIEPELGLHGKRSLAELTGDQLLSAVGALIGRYEVSFEVKGAADAVRLVVLCGLFPPSPPSPPLATESERRKGTLLLRLTPSPFPRYVGRMGLGHLLRRRSDLQPSSTDNSRLMTLFQGLLDVIQKKHGHVLFQRRRPRSSSHLLRARGAAHPPASVENGSTEDQTGGPKSASKQHNSSSGSSRRRHALGEINGAEVQHAHPAKADTGPSAEARAEDATAKPSSRPTTTASRPLLRDGEGLPALPIDFDVLDVTAALDSGTPSAVFDSACASSPAADGRPERASTPVSPTQVDLEGSPAPACAARTELPLGAKMSLLADMVSRLERETQATSNEAQQLRQDLAQLTLSLRPLTGC